MDAMIRSTQIKDSAQDVFEIAYNNVASPEINKERDLIN
jgi:hypothetical protein